MCNICEDVTTKRTHDKEHGIGHYDPECTYCVGEAMVADEVAREIIEEEKR